LERYNLMQAKPMEVISHLYYQLCVASRPVEDQQPALRSWTGGPQARVPGQELELEYVLQVLDWLFTQVKITYWPDTPHDDAAAPVCYLTRLQCVNAQPLAAGLLHTKHRPYDMLAAVFLCANCMPASEAQAQRLRAHQRRFTQMYLQQSMNFDYLPKDIYKHDAMHTSPPTARPAYSAPETQRFVTLACFPVACSVCAGRVVSLGA
jgi:hypothetical protein